MRIVGGNYRGKKLFSPIDDHTRPTSDRARESLFNILSHLLGVSGKTWDQISFCDVFSGTGAVGLEALSRGAAFVFFFENHEAARRILDKNISLFSREKHKCSVRGNAVFPTKGRGVDVLFMDAPYRRGLWEKALPAFDENGWISSQTVIVIETDEESPDLPSGFSLESSRRYGKNIFLFVRKV